MSEGSILALNRCPRCHRGRILRGLLTMNERCDSCGMPFEQETGQNWGSMFVAYLIGAVIAIPLFIILLVQKVDPLYTVAIPFAVLLIISPFTVRFSRLMWTHIMYLMHKGHIR